MPDPTESVGFSPKGARRVAAAARSEERFDRLRYNGTGPQRFAPQPRQRVGWPVRVTGLPSLGDPDLYPAVVLEFVGYDGGAPVWADGDPCWVVLTPGEAGPLADESEHLAAPVGVKDDDERLIFAVASAGGGGLTTANTDGTEVSTTTRLEFDTATGIRVDEDGGDPDVVSLIAASPTQWGAVTVTSQAFEGEKRFLGAIVRTEAAAGAAEPYVSHDVGANAATSAWVTEADGAGVRASASVQAEEPSADVHRAAVSGQVSAATGSWPKFDLFAESDDPGAGGGNRSWLYLRGGASSNIYAQMCVFANAATGLFGLTHVGAGSTTWAPANLWIYGTVADVLTYGTGGFPVRGGKSVLCDQGAGHGARRGGADWFGIDRDFAAGEYPIVRGGHVVGYWSGSGSPPPPPPPTPLPPFPAVPTTISLTISVAQAGVGPIERRQVSCAAATNSPQLTNASGVAVLTGVPVVAGGTCTVALNGSGETVAHTYYAETGGAAGGTGYSFSPRTDFGNGTGLFEVTGPNPAFVLEEAPGGGD
jgi:hypothetical protein